MARFSRIVERNAADGHLKVSLDLLFDLARAVPMRQREAAMDFRFVPVFWRKEIIEFLFRVDDPRMFITEFSGAFVQILLYRCEQFGRARDKILHWAKFFRFDRLISATHRHGILLQIARSNFYPQWHTFLDPLPVFHAAAELTPIYFRFDG